jgi:hypothetical protein
VPRLLPLEIRQGLNITIKPEGSIEGRRKMINLMLKNTTQCTVTYPITYIKAYYPVLQIH